MKIEKCTQKSFVVIGKEGSMAGAVHDFACPKTGKSYMFFPIKKL